MYPFTDDCDRFENGNRSTNATTPWTWELAEMFKLEKGKIHRIEAILDRSPYGMDAGWSSREDGLSDRARDVTGIR